MSEYNSNIYINSSTSKMVLNSIINKQKSVESLKEEYNKFITKKIIPNENIYKHYIFWEIVKEKFHKKISNSYFLYS